MNLLPRGTIVSLVRPCTICTAEGISCWVVCEGWGVVLIHRESLGFTRHVRIVYIFVRKMCSSRSFIKFTCNFVRAEFGNMTRVHTQTAYNLSNFHALRLICQHLVMSMGGDSGEGPGGRTPFPYFLAQCRFKCMGTHPHFSCPSVFYLFFFSYFLWISS